MSYRSNEGSGVLRRGGSDKKSPLRSYNNRNKIRPKIARTIDEEVAMKHWAFAWLMLLSAPVLAQESVPTIPFESVSNLLRLPPNLYLGEVTGVAVNSKKHIFVLSRVNTTGPAFGATAAQLLEFGPDGKFLREIGKNLYAWAFGHTVRVDKEDNIWAVDKGSDMIVKFNPEGRVVMVFGRKQEASDEVAPYKRTGPPPKHQDGRFRQPTDVTWDSAGNSYFSDGYVNSRIAKVDRNGNWLKSCPAAC